MTTQTDIANVSPGTTVSAAVVLVSEQALPVDERCPSCGGTGSRDLPGGLLYSNTQQCSTCHGAGYVSVQLVDQRGRKIAPAI